MKLLKYFEGSNCKRYFASVAAVIRHGMDEMDDEPFPNGKTYFQDDRGGNELRTVT